MARFGRSKKPDKGEGVKERLLEIQTDREGCEEIKGSFDEKTGMCQIRQQFDPEHPDQVLNKKFDEVKRPERMTGVETIETQ